MRIPQFNPQNKLHIQLAELSERAHQAAKSDDKESLKKIEDEIDRVSAQIRGLTKEEIKEIRFSLEQLKQ